MTTASRQVREAEMQLNSPATYMQMRGYPATVVIERMGENFVVKRRIHNADFTVGGYVHPRRSGRFLTKGTSGRRYE
jgi:hypothetical protein